MEWFELEQELEQIKQEHNVNLPGSWTIEDYNEFVLLLADLLDRDSETLNLYTPLKTAVAFHHELAHEVGLSGSNRAGKTAATSAEIAMAALGCHYLPDKYPREGCQIACVGNDGRHLALMFEYLFEKAAFQVYQHPVTLAWHVVSEDDEECKKYSYLWKPSKPMIPERMVSEIAWEDKKEKVPKLVRLHNGTVLRFYSGLVRKLPQGRRFHLVWMDEEIDQARKWIDEMRARIVDYNGRLIWSATPQNATIEFTDMSVKAENPENADKPLSQRTAFFIMYSSDNIYISKEGREAHRTKMLDDDEQMQIRYFGKSARNYLLVYPEFDDHNLIPDFLLNMGMLRYNDTRYIIIDPGRDTCAVMFAMVPEMATEKELPTLNEFERKYRTRPGCIVIYDELKIKRANQNMVALEIKAKLDQHPRAWVHDLTIDMKGGKSIVWKGMKEGESCEGLYMEAILKHDITPRNPGWKYGSPDVNYGIDKTRGMLMDDQDKLPHLFITRNCKNLIWELKAWKKKRDSLGNFKGYEEGNHDLLDCLRYATTRGLEWAPPPEPVSMKPLTTADYSNIMRDLRNPRFGY